MNFVPTGLMKVYKNNENAKILEIIKISKNSHGTVIGNYPKSSFRIIQFIKKCDTVLHPPFKDFKDLSPTLSTQLSKFLHESKTANYINSWNKEENVAIVYNQNKQFKHNFRDTINPMCPTNEGIEDTEHFLLFCPSREVPRRDLLAGVSALLPPLGNTDLSNEFLMQILLCSDKDFPDSLNKGIVLLTLRFIHETGRFG